MATDLSSLSAGALKRKVGWAAIFLGGLGVHKFLLGYRKAGIIMLAVGLLGWIPFLLPTLAMAIVGVVEGILYLSKSDEAFAATYLRGKREWF
jgi:TM2 domain-containing membrane protein YozV